jgi:hypothetical protein
VDRIYRHLRHTNSGTILEKPIGHSVRPETTSFAHTPNLRSTRPRRTVFGASGMVSTILRCASSCRSSLHNQTWSGSSYPRMAWRGPSVSRRCANDVYNPSCAHNPRWICPLAPPESRLSVPILAGELAFQDRPE